MIQQQVVIKKDSDRLWIGVSDESKLIDLILHGDFQAADLELYNEMLELKEKLQRAYSS